VIPHMLYEVQVTRHGVPYQEWEVGGATVDDPLTEAEAVAACRREREATGEHADADTYHAAEYEADFDRGDVLALASACELMPALRELIERRLAALEVGAAARGAVSA
jgi:hypothetical protein